MIKYVILYGTVLLYRHWHSVDLHQSVQNRINKLILFDYTQERENSFIQTGYAG